MQEDPVKSISKGFWDSLWEHVPIWVQRLFMNLKTIILKGKWQNEGTYPALMAVELTKTPARTERNTLLVSFQIHLTPRVRYHLEKFVICKQGDLSEVRNYIFGGVNNEFPQLHTGELGVPMKIMNLPYNRSPKVIDKIVDKDYLCPEATFEIPYREGEGETNVRIIAKTHVKGKSYELSSEWIKI